MSLVGIVSQDVVTKSRIAEALKAKGIETVYIHSAANFDPQEFDAIFVDLDSPQASIVLKSEARKCVAFGSPNDREKLEMARSLGCDQVYKHGEFFKKVLINFKI